MFLAAAAIAEVYAADVSMAEGADSAVPASASSTNRSPIEVFRNLLAMPPEEREKQLAIYPPELRPRIEAKLEEYQILPEPYREMRLQVTELRWYLLPLLQAPASERPARLNTIPEPMRRLVATRLDEWNLWPPQLRQEVLEYQSTLSRFVGHGADAHPSPVREDLPERERSELEERFASWQALPAEQRQQIYARFEHYFDLSEAEKQKILQPLPEPEREETERALGPIEKWPREQQEQYIAAFRRFAELSGEERRRFLDNAQRWQRMSEPERQAWRDLVKQLADAPPLPIGFESGSRRTASRPLPAGPIPGVDSSTTN